MSEKYPDNQNLADLFEETIEGSQVVMVVKPEKVVDKIREIQDELSRRLAGIPGLMWLLERCTKCDKEPETHPESGIRYTRRKCVGHMFTLKHSNPTTTVKYFFDCNTFKQMQNLKEFTDLICSTDGYCDKVKLEAASLLGSLRVEKIKIKSMIDQYDELIMKVLAKSLEA